GRHQEWHGAQSHDCRSAAGVRGLAEGGREPRFDVGGGSGATAETSPLVTLLPLALAARVLTLDEAGHTAQAHQPQIRAAWAQVHSGQARVGEAKAGFFPRLDANAQYQRSTANFPLSPSFSASSFAVALKGQPNLLSPGATVNFYTFGITATQTIYDFGRT